MQTNFRRFARHIAAPLICAGAIGGAAIGLAGTAGASTGSNVSPDPNPSATVRGPLIVATPPHTTAPHWLQPRHRVLLLSPDTSGE
jgi:hypothetical protein